MGTDRDRVWAGVLRVSNEQAGFSIEEISRVCEELFGEDAPSRDTIDDTVATMIEWNVLESFGFNGGVTYYIRNDEDINP
ncbi:hypothetical protein [Halonotius pteroides]|uniref:Winged helix-turn-helix domain-containing protein n=1 Tax=Halonotius pteroides TaxID=268735 RepID=A0A3A6Q5T0_9EURY|nr:hypothetical protein [Halonotius pteroides]RJX48831.1 hypothetical protein DP106_10590 [Halonotius pteroides]